MRTYRFNKRKSLEFGSPPPTKVSHTSIGHASASTSGIEILSSSDYEEHLERLRAEMAKPEPQRNNQQIRMLMAECFSNRQSFIRDHPIHENITEYPALLLPHVVSVTILTILGSFHNYANVGRSDS